MESHPKASGNGYKLGAYPGNIETPQKVVEYSPIVKHYYRQYKNRTSSAKYLRVIVKYLNGEGFIVTAQHVLK